MPGHGRSSGVGTCAFSKRCQAEAVRVRIGLYRALRVGCKGEGTPVALGRGGDPGSVGAGRRRGRRPAPPKSLSLQELVCRFPLLRDYPQKE